MSHIDHLSFSFKQFWNNKSLLSVMLLEFILTFLLGILFFVADLAIITVLNKAALGAIVVPIDSPQYQQAFLIAIWNMHTILVIGVILLMQSVILVYVDSFFKSGFYGMIKNVIQDGSTSFKEFLPEAKRYWHAMFRLLLLRYAIFAAVAIPFIFSLVSVLGTTQQFLSATQITLFSISIVLLIIVGLLTFFWL